ncbi:protein-disulfide reductase DsbD family protein [Aerosticca soli]|uniref:Cytochrome c-type biogenesis protein DsbD, protein-disulfide reductase n=1 Tax=Aerosticca soli TaxID=2010829 RepID=A0A2Z6E8L0_9GAMM|nr:protein-disulfide reductase DsbD [Aerosticca soli]BBD81162.1 cytochrome c-type biogenesis protein DsbD, protein-disulfide reductase [Aerosticca soli]
MFARLFARAAFLALLMLLPSTAAVAQEADGLLPVTAAYRLEARVQAPDVLVLQWTIAPDYYLYRGRMQLTAGPGVELGPAAFPDGEKHQDPYLGAVEIYHGKLEARVPFKLAPGTDTLTLDVRYQGCHEVEPKICYPPHTEHLRLALPSSPTTGGGDALGRALAALGAGSGGTGAGAAPLPPEQAFRLSALARDPHTLLLRWDMPPNYYLYRDRLALRAPESPGVTLHPRWPAGGVQREDPEQGPVTVYVGPLELPVDVSGPVEARHPLTLEVRFQGCQDGGLCYPPMTRTLKVDFGSAPPAAASRPDAVQRDPGALALALVLALAGGLVLNLMPCVLPVLSLKAVGLLESGESPARRRAHALAYSAGVMVSFAVLGLLVSAARAAWGVQLQQPLLVAVLALVMLAVGLSMSGLVQLGAGLGNTGAALAGRGGWVGDFFTGVLAVVVASPCTAPFMGSALAYALAAPRLGALLVFLALGFGLALPFLAVGFVPALARRLPRPGRWMQTLKELLAFPMYLSAAWLAWVLAHQRGADAVGMLLAAAVALAMTLWWFERSRERGLAARMLLLPLAALIALPLLGIAALPRPAPAAAAADVVPYAAERLAALRRAGTPVFVDITADWCVTCKANEHAVLDTAAFRAVLARTGAVYMRGDWTDEDPAISAFLAAHHSPGVPLYVVYPADGGEGRPLPSVLTPGLVRRALEEAARR